MNCIEKVYFDNVEELLRKRFHLFSKEIIIPEKEFDKLERNTVISLKVQGNYFSFIKGGKHE